MCCRACGVQREEMAERREEVVKRLKQKMEDEWKAKTGGDEGGKDGEQVGGGSW